MIRGKRGVVVSGQQSWADAGVEEVAWEVRWLTEPGWLMIEAEAPTLCLMATEVGGRCELRAKPDQPVDGGYFGFGALSFAAPGASIAVHAAEMRQGRICCFAFHAAGADFLKSEDLVALERLQSRYMFRDERLRTCATLLDAGRVRGDSAAFIVSLSKALFAAVLDLATDTDKRSKVTALTGASWDAISRYIRDNLDEAITVETLADIARMPPERFGSAFRDATGMSVRQWEMDHRVRSAQRLLADNPNESLVDVAALCGFADQSHFTRAFLKVVGLTPTTWLHRRT